MTTATLFEAPKSFESISPQSGRAVMRETQAIRADLQDKVRTFSAILGETDPSCGVDTNRYSEEFSERLSQTVQSTAIGYGAELGTRIRVLASRTDDASLDKALAYCDEIDSMTRKGLFKEPTHLVLTTSIEKENRNKTRIEAAIQSNLALKIKAIGSDDNQSLRMLALQSKGLKEELGAVISHIDVLVKSAFEVTPQGMLNEAVDKADKLLTTLKYEKTSESFATAQNLHHDVSLILDEVSSSFVNALVSRSETLLAEGDIDGALAINGVLIKLKGAGFTVDTSPTGGTQQDQVTAVDHDLSQQGVFDYDELPILGPVEDFEPREPEDTLSKRYTDTKERIEAELKQDVVEPETPKESDEPSVWSLKGFSKGILKVAQAIWNVTPWGGRDKGQQAVQPSPQELARRSARKAIEEARTIEGPDEFLKKIDNILCHVKVPEDLEDLDRDLRAITKMAMEHYDRGMRLYEAHRTLAISEEDIAILANAKHYFWRRGGSVNSAAGGRSGASKNAWDEFYEEAQRRIAKKRDEIARPEAA